MKRALSRPRTLLALGLALAALRAAHAQPGGPAPPVAPSVVVTATAAASVNPAAAVPGAASKPAKPAKPAKLDPARVTEDLAHPETARAGLEAVRAAGPEAKKLAPRVEELLSKGLPADLAIAASDALGAIGSPGSSAALAPYVRHRSAAVRKAAVIALGRTGGPAASDALRSALRGGDPEVRGAAAASLGSAGGAESAPDLLRALDLGVAEAAPSVAALCSAAQCDELLARWPRLSAEGRRAALSAMLKRRPALPEAVLLRAVDATKVSEGASAKAFFQGLEASFKGAAKVRAALRAAARAPADASKKGAGTGAPATTVKGAGP